MDFTTLLAIFQLCSREGTLWMWTPLFGRWTPLFGRRTLGCDKRSRNWNHRWPVISERTLQLSLSEPSKPVTYGTEQQYFLKILCSGKCLFVAQAELLMSRMLGNHNSVEGEMNRYHLELTFQRGVYTYSVSFTNITRVTSVRFSHTCLKQI